MLDHTRFMPRRNCGQWWEGWWEMAFVSDVAIALAYIGISILLIVLAARAIQSGMLIELAHGSSTNSFTLLGLFVLFAAFIFLCGLGHAIDAIAYFRPYYHLMAAVRLLTAIVSIATLPALYFGGRFLVNWYRGWVSKYQHQTS